MSVEESTPLLEDNDSQGKGATIASGIFNLVVTMIGAGAMAMPVTLREAGWVFGFFIMMLCALITLLSCLALCHCAHYSRGADYDTLVLQFLGNRGGTVINGLFLILLYGSLCLFLIISVELMYPFVMEAISLLSLRIILTLLVGLISLPTTLHALRHTSLLGIGCLLFILLALLHRIFAKGFFYHLQILGPAANNPDIAMFKFSSAAGMVLPIQGLAFACHINAPRVQSELPPSKRSQMGFVLSATVAIGMVFYFLLSYSGFLYFQGHPSDDVLNDFPKQDVLMDGCRVMLSLLLVLKYPLLLQPLKEWFEKLLVEKYIPESSGTARAVLNFALTYGIVFSVMIGTILVPQLSMAMEVIGSTSCCVIAYVAPGLMLFALNSDDCEYRKIQTPDYHPPFYLVGTCGKVSALVSILFGCVTTILGLAAFVNKFSH